MNAKTTILLEAVREVITWPFAFRDIDGKCIFCGIDASLERKPEKHLPDCPARKLKEAFDYYKERKERQNNG